MSFELALDLPWYGDQARSVTGPTRTQDLKMLHTNTFKTGQLKTYRIKPLTSSNTAATTGEGFKLVIN